MRKVFLVSLYLLSEIALFASYWSRQASFHWFTHFYVGGIVALLGLTIWKSTSHRRVIWPLAWLLLAHLFAMLPDLFFSIIDLPHGRWMDIFFGHISSHYIPGRNWTWYVLFMISFAIYLLVTTIENNRDSVREKQITQT